MFSAKLEKKFAARRRKQNNDYKLYISIDTEDNRKTDEQSLNMRSTENLCEISQRLAFNFPINI